MRNLVIYWEEKSMRKGEKSVLRSESGFNVEEKRADL